MNTVYHSEHETSQTMTANHADKFFVLPHRPRNPINIYCILSVALCFFEVHVVLISETGNGGH